MQNSKKSITFARFFIFSCARMRAEGLKIWIIVLIVCLLSPRLIVAQDHYLRLSPTIGYAMDMAADKSWGVAAEVGAGYRLQYKHFIFDVGVGGQYLNLHNQLPNIEEQKPAVDIQNVPYTGLSFWSERNDVAHRILVNMPVMVGGQWNKIYFLVGANMNLHVWGRADEEGLYTYQGQYERYIQPLSSLPQYGFVTDEFYRKNQQVIDFNYDIRVAAEVAYCVNAEKDVAFNKLACYVGLFVEYSVLHLSDFTPLVAGAKLTLLWRMKERKHCMCYNY